MKHNWIRVSLYGCFLLLLAACNSAGAPTLPDETVAQPAALPSAAATQAESEKTQPTPSSSMQALVEKAKEDLAQRLSIATTEIDLVEASVVVWPDASLGCPQLGVVYPEVQTAGYFIKLEANSWSYEYHTDTNQQVVFCEENVMQPVQKPGDIKDGDPWMQ